MSNLTTWTVPIGERIGEVLVVNGQPQAALVYGRGFLLDGLADKATAVRWLAMGVTVRGNVNGVFDLKPAVFFAIMMGCGCEDCAKYNDPDVEAWLVANQPEVAK